MTGSSTQITFRALITGKEKLLLRLIGPITEVADFGPLKFSRLKPLEIDLSEITAMNSVGIREFAAWAAKLENKVLEFSHCPKFFIDQVNMIQGLIPPQSRFLSFYVPYYDRDSDEEQRVLFRQGLEFKGSGKNLELHLPEILNEEGVPLEIDVMPDRYFQFLKKFT